MDGLAGRPHLQGYTRSRPLHPSPVVVCGWTDGRVRLSQLRLWLSQPQTQLSKRTIHPVRCTEREAECAMSDCPVLHPICQ